MIRDVHLHGRLGTKFGRVHALDVESPAEAFQALGYQLPGFRDYVAKRRYVVSVGQGTVLDQETLDLRLGAGRDIHLTPAGLVTGLEVILLTGILLFTAVAAVAVLSMPGVPAPGAREESTRTDSFIFDGPVNNSEQGHPVALIYGQMRVGSVVGSTGITTTDVTEAGVSADPSNPGGAGDYSGYVGSTPGVKDSPNGSDWQYALAKGGKGGSGGQARSAQEDPNSLQSQATAKILDIIGEGEIVGLVDGLRSVYFDGTPLQNADDSFNFAGVAVEQRTGLPDQDFMPGFAQTENTVQVDTRVAINPGPVTRSVLDPAATVARVTVRIPQLYRQDTTNGDLKTTSVSVKVMVQADGGGFTEVTTMVFNGKTTSGYQRSVDVRLPNGVQRDIRLVRVTADSTVSSLLNETRWDLLTSVVEAKLSYPDTAMVGVTVDARQFGSNVPNRGYEVKGLIIDVPSNYDPINRTYAGVWDGTFKRAWTDNPAWVFRDLVVNRRYGLGSRVPLDALNKWALYSIAQYNDEMIPDGPDALQPRYTINCCINSQADAREVLASVASNFRGWAYLSAGTITAAQDRPEDPSVIVTPANVARDEPISYARVTSADERRSVAVVYWNDPEDGYRLTPELYEVPDLVRRFGRKTGNEVTAFGVTNRGQANRMARWIMEDEAQGSNSVATYGVGEDHAFVEPGRIAVLHDPMFTAERRGGRVRAAGPHQVTLDKPITLTQGTAYLLRVALPDGSVRVRNVTNAAGTADVITLAGNAFAASPLPGAVWTVESAQVASRQFRVRAIEQDEPPYRVRAILHDPTKYERVELGRDISSPGFMDLPSGPLERPSGLDIKEFLLPLGTAVEPAVQFSWNSATDPRVALYQVQYQPPGAANWSALPDNLDTSRDVRGATPGTWSFRVRALDVLGNKTAWTQYSEYLGAQQSSLPNVSELAVAVDDSTLQVALVWTLPTDTRPLRAEVLFGPVLTSAESLGIIDGQEFTVSQLGRYWVRTVFMGAVSAGPPSVVVDATTIPHPAWEVIQGKPDSVAELDPDYVSGVNVALGSLNASIYTAGTGLLARSDAMFADLNTATTGLKARSSTMFADLYTATTGLKPRSDAMFADINTATTGLKAKVDSALASLNTPTTGVLARLTATENAVSSNNSAAVSRLSALEATVNTAGTGLSARVLTAESAITSLGTGKADATRVTALEVQSKIATAALLPERVSVGTNFTSNLSGRPEDAPDFVTGTVVADATEGDVRRMTTLTNLVTKGWLPVGTGRTFRATVRARVITDGTDNRTSVGFRTIDAAFASIGPINDTAPLHSVADGWQTFTCVRTSEQLKVSSPNVAWVKAFTRVNRNNGNTLSGATSDVAFLMFEDVTDEVALSARVGLVETATTDGRFATASRVGLIETSLNQSGTGVLARLSSVEQSISTPTTGYAARTAALEATINTAGTGLSARMGVQEAATVSLATNKADVTRVVTLEAKSQRNSEGYGTNSTFDKWTGPYPDGLSIWNSSPAPAKETTLTSSGVNAMRYVITTASQQTGATFSSSFFSPSPDAEWVVVIADVYLVSGTLSGAGILLDPTSGPTGRVAIDFLAEFPTSPTGKWFQVRKLVRRTVRDAGFVNYRGYLMSNYAGGLSPLAVKDVIFGRVDVRAATPLEIDSQRVITALDAGTYATQANFTALQQVVTTPTTGLVARTTALEATFTAPSTGVLARLSSVEQSITTPTTGLVARTTALEATINTAGTGLSARIGSAETAITNLGTGKADASRVAALEVSINTAGTGLSARTGLLETATASLQANKADASRVSLLEARATSLPNLLIGGDFTTPWEGLWEFGAGTAERLTSTLYGPYVFLGTSGYAQSKAYPCVEGDQFSIGLDGETTGVNATFCVQFLPSEQRGPLTYFVPGDWTTRRRSTAPGVAPAGTTGWRALIEKNGAPYINFSRVKVNAGPVATDGSDESTQAAAQARLGVVESAAASLAAGKADASRVTALEATINTSGTGLLARVGSAESAIVTLGTGKADVSRVVALEARVTGFAGTIIPQRVSVGTDFTTSLTGTPAAATPLTTGTVVTNADEGEVRQFTTVLNVHNRDWLPIGTGQTFRVTTRFRAVADGTANLTQVSMRCMMADGSAAGLASLANISTTVAAGWLTSNTMERTSEQLKAAYPGAAFVRGMIRPNRNSANTISGATTEVAYLRLENVTTEASLLARTGSLETATASLATGKADASRVTSLEATVNTGGTGLLARTGALETATASLLTGKADASRVTLLEARRPSMENLLVRANAAAADGTVTFGLAGWGFRMTGTGSGSQEKSFNIWGLKQNTAYSLRVVARRLSGSGSKPITVDLFPDTLPELVSGFDIQSNVATEYTWPNIISGSADMLSAPVKLRFFRPNMEAGVVVEITDMVFIESVVPPLGWAPAPTDTILASTALTARIATVEQVAVDLGTGKADASRVGTLEAIVNTAGTGLAARLTTVETVTASSATKLAEARFVKIADAGGGRPAIFGLFSDSLGTSEIRLDAAKLYWGDNTVFVDATDTLETVWGTTRKVMALGAPFGPDNLTEWEGASNIALSAMTKDNARFWRSSVAPYIGGTAFAGSNFTAVLNVTSVGRSRLGAGSVSTSPGDVVVTCTGGTSGASIVWVMLSGDATIAGGGTSFTPVFNTNVAAFQSKSAKFMGIVTKAGQQSQVYIDVDFQETS